mmetsp:Transcript_15794/g.26405  ORF Transcript_15794/g.26405 Transcript_15794/m.26405 type:complete len:193 (-) Transcript_15794:298-876(-)
MSGFEKKENNEGFEEVHMSQSTDEEEVSDSSNQVVEAVNISKYDKEETNEEEKESNASSMDNVVPMTQISNGWSVVSGWMKKGAQQAGPMWEKAKQVTADTVEATAPARSQFYDLSLKVAADVAPAAQVMTDVAGSTLNVVGEALVSTSEIVSTSLNNATQELSEFASEMQNGPPKTEQSQEEPPKPTNTSV